MGNFSVICDLDGVLHRRDKVIAGAPAFVRGLRRSGRKYVFMTNSPDHSPSEVSRNLQKLGLDVDESHIYTSAQAVAAFLACHARCPKVFMIGSPALREELRKRQVRFVEKHPEFVVFGTGGEYNLETINQAVEYVAQGAKLIAAAAEPTSLTEKGFHAGSGALLAPIEKATRKSAYVVGKPNHFMIRQAEVLWKIKPLETLTIGDSLETDVDVGLQAEMKTVLVLTGNTTRKMLQESAYQPDYVFESVASIDWRRLP